MFYSHEVLTSRKYGVATVWLVATLGAKSSLKRINRKQILDVDVSKACQTIVDPVAPMALRLQGNLLYGVSRVYLQQCGYVLSDAQTAHNAMRMMLRTVENRGLDPEAGKAHPEQLILPDDPSFLPGHALGLPEDLLDLDLNLEPFIDIVRSADSQSLTPFGSQVSQQSSSHAGELGGIVLPSSSPGPQGSFRVQGADEDVGMTGLIGDDVEFHFDEPEFTFDEDGQLVEGPSVRAVARTSVGVGVPSGAARSARGHEVHVEGEAGEVQIPDDPMELDLPVLGDDLPEGISPAGALSSSQDIEVVHSTSTTSAPLRQKQRKARVLPHDTRMELKNKDLASWNTNYLQNMATALKEKKKNRDSNQAKKIADQFVWGNGIGDIAQQFIGTPVPSPFDHFMGDNLFELVTGAGRTKRGRPKKRDRDSGIDDETQEESRNVRQKSNELEAEVGRGLEDEGVFPLGDDEVELPREAASPLDDEQIFSAMPWNISASIRGSSVVPRSGMNMTDQGRPGSRPGSRMVSASPLRGRGQPLDSEALKNLTSDANFGFGGDDFGGLEPSSSANLAVTITAPTTRVTEALSAEGENFVAFVGEALVEKRNHLQAEGELDTDEVNFEELLPPRQNSRMIACQGLMMVLGLGTKGMLDVQQPDHFGDINIKLTDKARATQVIEISEGEESDSDETIQDDDVAKDGQGEDEAMEDVDGGQFEEQFAAGQAGAEGDDRDSLYDD